MHVHIVYNIIVHTCNHNTKFKINFMQVHIVQNIDIDNFLDIAQNN